MRLISIFILSFICINAFGQKKKFESFREGTFWTYDSGFSQLYKIVRDENTQVEMTYKLDKEKGDTVLVATRILDLKWVSNKSYILTYSGDESLNELEELVMKNGGLKVILVDVIDNCLHYKTVFLGLNEKGFTGIMCK